MTTRRRNSCWWHLGTWNRRKKFIRFFYGVSVLTFLTTLTYISFEDTLKCLMPPPSEPVKSNKNYFLDIDRVIDMGLVINTSSCQIPDFSPWDSAVIPFIRKVAPLQDCIRTSYNWSSLVGNELVMHTSEMDEDGYPLEPDFCCYKVVERVEQSLINYNTNADNMIKYSSCVSISQERTLVKSEFLVVECSWPIGVKVIYKGYHGSAVTKDLEATAKKTSKESKKPSTLSKVNHWKNQKDTLDNRPPNIVLVGQDSTSRLNFRRNMLKTMNVLESLGAVEMRGYTKVGENTFPNFCPLLSGYPEEDFKHLCAPTDDHSLDLCPLIYRRFDEANYLTALVEDSPGFTAFNYMRTGFVHQPVDFYSRPLFLAASDYGLLPSLPVFRAEHIDCLGQMTNDEIIISYLESAVAFAHQNSSPLFALSWSTTLPHDNLNYVQLSDDAYSKFILRLEEKGYLENTILFFMGDHGYRYGPTRETLIGYFEDKLPNLWIRVPPRLQEKYPLWQKALQINSERVTSPYVLYWTLQSLLEQFTGVKKPVQDEQTRSGKTIPRPHGKYTFFEEVPENASCGDMNIPDNYCACYPLQQVDLGDSLLQEAAEQAVQWLNSNTLKDTGCQPLFVSKVTAGAYMNKSRILLNGQTERVGRYIVGFLTNPGQFLIEAELNYFHDNSTFSPSPNVQRASKINKAHVGCAKTSKVELFCFCSS